MSMNLPSFISFSNTNCYKGKRIISLAKLPSSSVHSPFESSFTNISSMKRSYSRSSPGHQANAIGIIGGEFTDSTLQFARKLMNLNLENIEENGTAIPPLVTCSDQALTNEFLSFGMTSFSLPIHADLISLVVNNLKLQRRFLEQSGKVSCIVMPCNLLHAWHDEIKEECSVPFLHMGECVAKELKEAKLKPVEGRTLPRIGVLATNKNSVARFYRDKLEKEGFGVIVPDKGTIERIMIPAVEALSAKDYVGSQNLLRISVHILLMRAANRVILASDELRGVLPKDDPLWRKCIDPMDCLARSAVKYAHNSLNKTR